ncbi:TPA: hypothetical protein N0F65_000392 [Lagenidium giganteum]|uniref:Homoserine dehydrogenase n=1 Tax=Lagenidium giganteum TaxID=4803 RepID=A0AAV2YYK8_9STRA|nr:TPA: hypothetical protein N0F65_000392 [Lagenidium giganteum]
MAGGGALMDCTSPSASICTNWVPDLQQQTFSLDAAAAANGCEHLDHRQGKRNVYKFGGTSVGSPARLCGLVKIVREERARILAVVVSAMGDTTDYLLEAVDFAANGDGASAQQVIARVEQVCLENAHTTQRLLAEELAPGSAVAVEDMTAVIAEFLKPLRELLFGISLLQEKTSAAMDTVLSFGERISGTIVAKLLTKAGIDAFFLDSREWMTTDSTFGCAKVYFEESKQKIQSLAAEWNGRLPVITGFIGRAKNGRTTTLGRNGSDYTATIVGASLQADYVVINTDISGVMTADPRIVDRAVALSHLNHHEALELAVYGTRMFHARTMVPLIHSGVTMLIRNTMDPNGHGTYISSTDKTGKAETCTTSLENLAILEVRTRILQDGGPGAQENIGARITKLLESHKVPVWLSIRGAHGQAISVVIPARLEKLTRDILATEMQSELESEEIDPITSTSPVTMLSIVAEEFSKIPVNQAKFFAALADANVDVLAVGQGTSSRSLSCVIHGKDTKLAVRRVHDAFNVDYLVTNVVLLGCNHITLEVVRQIQKQVDLYRSHHKALVRIVGFGSNCADFIFDPKGFSLEELVERLEKCQQRGSVVFQDRSACSGEHYRGAPSSEQLDAFQELPIPILMDCSGQRTPEELYLACIERGIHVVVSNARSVSALPPTKSRESVATNSRNGRTFLMYTSTIGASLPVIDTLGSIVRTGDRLLRLETSLSGSMGFVTNLVMRGKKLSEAVREALELGYCEQDPREDLTGKDSVAKILVLARALGVQLESAAIRVEPLVPLDVLDDIVWTADMCIDDIVAGIHKYDDVFHQRFYAPAVAQGKRLRFVATIDLAKLPQIEASIAPQLVDEDHPAYYTKADEIAVGFATQQYSPRPLVLKGTGTGATASATGVLRDLIKILHTMHGKTA